MIGATATIGVDCTTTSSGYSVRDSSGDVASAMASGMRETMAVK